MGRASLELSFPCEVGLGHSELLQTFLRRKGLLDPDLFSIISSILTEPTSLFTSHQFCIYQCFSNCSDIVMIFAIS